MAAPRQPADTGCAPAEVQGERARLKVLQDLDLLDTAPEALFDDIAALAAQLCGTPVALVSLVDEHRQWFKARVGLAATETPREIAFCAHAIQQPGEVMVVPDASRDARFADNPLVTAAEGLRFYSGAPIVVGNGHAVGTVCVLDRRPRQASAAEQASLQALARQAARLMEWRGLARQQALAQRDEVQRSQQHLSWATAMAAHTLDLQTFIDTQGRVRYVNERYLDYWGLPREQVEGHPISDIVGERDYRERVAERLARALAGEAVHYTASLEFPVRGARQMSVSYLPVRDDAGVVIGVVGRAVDVHDIESARLALALANEALMQKQEVQQRFIHMLSHDLREPVNTICNFAGLLHEDHGDELRGAGAQYLAFIRQGGQRMRTLLDDLLAYVRLDHRDSALLNPQPVDLQVVFKHVLADLDHASSVHQARLAPAVLPVVWGDASLLRLLFQNLLANAIKFHPPGVPPVVSWGFEAAPGGVAVFVQDSGIGIAAEHQGRLFNTFSRLVTRQQYEGTGLGLATCRRIAELHGGHISVQSEPGAGSRFTVTLPVQASPPGAAPSPSTAGAPP